MQSHALAEDKQLRRVSVNEFCTFGYIYLIRVLGKDGEIDHRPSVGDRVNGNEVPQRSHGLGAQMTTPTDVVVHDVPYSPRLGMPVGPIQVVHDAAVRGGIGHLPADKPCLHFGAAEELFQLLLYLIFHLGNEPGALIIKSFQISQCFHFAVFGVPA